MYKLVQKKGSVLLSISLAWPAVAGCSWAETFSQLSSISFAQPCMLTSLRDCAASFALNVPTNAGKMCEN